MRIQLTLCVSQLLQPEIMTLLVSHFHVLNPLGLLFALFARLDAVGTFHIEPSLGGCLPHELKLRQVIGNKLCLVPVDAVLTVATRTPATSEYQSTSI